MTVSVDILTWKGKNLTGSFQQTKNNRQIKTAERELSSLRDEVPDWLFNTTWLALKLYTEKQQKKRT